MCNQVNFNFGQSNTDSSSESQNKKREKEPDILILVDAFWLKVRKENVMKIRFIPYQMDYIELILVFKLKYNDENHDKEQAVFKLSFKIPNTWGEDGLFIKKDESLPKQEQDKEFKIRYSDLKTSFSDLGIEKESSEYQYYFKLSFDNNFYMDKVLW